MKKHKLGRTGLTVTDICLGTMTWGNQNTEAEGHAQMDYALDAGINFFDTAEMYAVPPSAETYGKTETIIGTWFAKHKNRDQVILATKAAGSGQPWVRGGSKLTSETVQQAIDASLKRLQTDYIDLYQIHWPTRPGTAFANHGAGKNDFTKVNNTEADADLLTVLEGVGAAVKSGKVRHFGLSNESAWGIMAYLRLAEKYDLPRVASIQNEFGILNRLDDPYVAETCVREDIAYLPWSPLGGGLVSGKYANGARPLRARWTVDPRVPHRDTQWAHMAVAAYQDVAKKHGLDICQMALAFARQQSFVTSVIIGATTMEQLKTDIASADLVLSDDVLKDIDAVYRQYPMPF